MLILSKKDRKDYYDGVVGSMGIDKTIVFDRTPQEFDDKHVDFPKVFQPSKDWRERNYYRRFFGYSFAEKYKEKYDFYNYFIVFFCGKPHIGWEFIKTDNYNIIDKHITYDIEEVKKILVIKNETFYNINFDDSINYILNHDMMELHRKYNTPILALDMNVNRYNNWRSNSYSNSRAIFYVNAVLKPYEFYKVFDTFTAFQEIQMFIGGVLTNPEQNMVNISNESRIKKHGFDKWSFRKESKNKK